MANEKLKGENQMLKMNVSKKHFSSSPSPSHEEYNVPTPLTPPQSYSSLSSPEVSESVSSPPTSPEIVTMANTHTFLVQ